MRLSLKGFWLGVVKYEQDGEGRSEFGAIWRHDVHGDNQDLRLQLAEERRARLELAEVVDGMRRGQEPRGGTPTLWIDWVRSDISKLRLQEHCDMLVVINVDAKMSTPVYVDPERSTQADGAQSSRVPVPLPEDPYEAIRRAYLVGTDIESEPFEDPESETPESPHIVASPVSLPDSTPPVCHVEESEGSDTSGAGSTLSDSTTPLSPGHPLTRDTLVFVSSLRRTARMTVHVQPVLSPGYSARIVEAAATSDVAFCKRFRSSYKNSPSPTLPVRKRYRGTSELILGTDSEGDELEDEEVEDNYGSHGRDDEGRGIDDEGHRLESDGLGLEEEEEAVPGGQQQAAPVVGTTVSTPLGLGYRALRRRELALEEDEVYSTFEVGQGSGSAPESERSERVSAFRQPTLTTWTDSKDGMIYIDIPDYPPPAPPVQTPPLPDWTPGSLPVSPSLLDVPSLVSSPMVPLTVSSPVTTSTATIPIDEDQFIEIGAQLELYRGILQDHTQRLDAMLPTLFVKIDRDVRELYTRSGFVRDEIFSQRYWFRSLKYKQERVAVTFRAIWRLMLALEAWAGQTNAQRVALWHAISDVHGENQDLRLHLAEERHARLELAEVVDGMKRGQEPRGGV
ncbi:hypothetical protein Tco_1064373 [Tanacetum coccineum]